MSLLEEINRNSCTISVSKMVYTISLADRLTNIASDLQNRVKKDLEKYTEDQVYNAYKAEIDEMRSARDQLEKSLDNYRFWEKELHTLIQPLTKDE